MKAMRDTLWFKRTVVSPNIIVYEKIKPLKRRKADPRARSRRGKR